MTENEANAIAQTFTDNGIPCSIKGTNNGYHIIVFYEGHNLYVYKIKSFIVYTESGNTLYSSYNLADIRNYLKSFNPDSVKTWYN